MLFTPATWVHVVVGWVGRWIWGSWIILVFLSITVRGTDMVFVATSITVRGTWTVCSWLSITVFGTKTVNGCVSSGHWWSNVLNWLIEVFNVRYYNTPSWNLPLKSLFCRTLRISSYFIFHMNFFLRSNLFSHKKCMSSFQILN